jgi:hypothetical protein
MAPEAERLIRAMADVHAARAALRRRLCELRRLLDAHDATAVSSSNADDTSTRSALAIRTFSDSVGTR